MTCTARGDLGLLVDYWTGELSEEEARLLEEHLFDCPSCRARLAGVERLAAAVRQLVREGRFRSVVPASLVDRLAADGLRIRTFRVAPGGVTPCGVAAEDELLVARLAGDLRGLDRVDLIVSPEGGAGPERLADVPFDAGVGEVVLVERVDLARRFPSHRLNLRLVGHGAGSERVIADYTLAHDAAGPPAP
jgi:hypothetical protein